MAVSGIAEIDRLLDGVEPQPPVQLPPGPVPTPGVGAIQDLLRGHAFSQPMLGDDLYGLVTKKLRKHLLAFCKAHQPAAVVGGAVPDVSKATLQALLSVPAVNPLCSQVYVTRALDLAFDGYAKIACLVARGESRFKFTAKNRNTDAAGLSLGIIQWAQSQLRLSELLEAIPKELLAAAFGSGDLADKVLALVKTVDAPNDIRGGVKRGTGKPLDPALDLAVGDWPGRFDALCRDVRVQKVQVTLAANDLKDAKPRFDAVDASPKSERLVGYLLDLVNQYGVTGGPKLFKEALDDPTPLPTTLKNRDAELMRRMMAIALARLKAIGKKIVVSTGKQKWSDADIVKIQASRQSRGDFFTATDLLADTAFTL